MMTENGGVPTGPSWDEILSVEFLDPRAMRPEDVPTLKGIYVWIRDGSPVYAGRAKGIDGLRGRLKAHLALGRDLSRSTFRSWVAVSILGLPRSETRRRPSVMTDSQVRQVNDWISACRVGWITRATAGEVVEFEKQLLQAWKPPLNR
jgi:hypothetical protein